MGIFSGNILLVESDKCGVLIPIVFFFFSFHVILMLYVHEDLFLSAVLQNAAISVYLADFCLLLNAVIKQQPLVQKPRSPRPHSATDI
jgi:hypothetical protein